jgi:acyl-CoA hydrolase
MELEIVVEAENAAEGSKRLAATGFFTMVAVDDSGRPAPVPPWHPETEEELAKWHEVEKRRKGC